MLILFFFLSFKNFYLFIYLFLAVLGLRFCVRAFSSCGKRGPLFIAVRGSLTIVASLVAEHRLQTRRLSSCGSRAHLLRGMWDLLRPGLEPMSPALAGRFSTIAPPGKPLILKRRCVCEMQPGRRGRGRRGQRSILGAWLTHLGEAELQGKCFWERTQPQSGLPEMVQPESSGHSRVTPGGKE